MTRSAFLLLAACAGRPPESPVAPAVPDGDSYRLIGGQVAGIGPAEVEVRDGVITAVGTADPSLRAVDVDGATIEPGWVDSHVHLAYRSEAQAMADGGVAVAVDLAAPLGFLDDLPPELEVLAAGPMITAVDGYPTRSWGANGYGLEVSGAEAAAAAVERLADAGARLIKVPITGDAVLDEAALTAVVQAAHARDLKVAVHATGEAEAALAARVGCDVLAHTPTESLTDQTVALWADRAVITTLGAFGGSDTTVDNLRRLADAGATVLYGTDFGNTRTPGVDPRELDLLAAAGLSPEDILACGTAVPAAWWGLPDYGEVAVGKRAVFRLVESP